MTKILRPLFVLSGIATVVLTVVLATAHHTTKSIEGRSSDAGSSPKRPFTVKDAIELSAIVSPRQSGETVRDPDIVLSPDRERFLVITEKGVLPKNKIESTIWLFTRRAALDAARHHSFMEPGPRPLVTFEASSNTPVISQLRWLDSKRISFTGKNNSSYQQLFIADVDTGGLSALTASDVYVSTYDIRGDVVAYLTLNNPQYDDAQEDALIDVKGKSIYTLLYPRLQALEDLSEEGSVAHYGSSLHLQVKGRDIFIPFQFDNEPLKVFTPIWSLYPPLALSPDGKSLITVAFRNNIPPDWSDFDPSPGWGYPRLTPVNRSEALENNPFKPLQFVSVDVQTGRVSALLNAPVGRSLGYAEPIEALWLGDSKRVILCNTFLPLNFRKESVSKRDVANNPFIVMVDESNHEIQPIAEIIRPLHGQSSLDRVTWREAESEITLMYLGNGETSEKAYTRKMKLIAGEWVQMPLPRVDSAREKRSDPELFVEQRYDQSPVLVAQPRGESNALTVWDPNPQLSSIALGKVSLYQWHDQDHHLWSGMLALPSNYDPRRRYPLVIQTHGVDQTKYFVDGTFTTGSVGRAMVAKGVVVLQMSWLSANFQTPQDGPLAMEGFQSAIAHLAADGIVDSSRVGVIGFSYTCFHVLYTLVHNPKLFAAATITDGNNMSYLQYLLSTDSNNGLQQISEATNGGMPFGQNVMHWIDRAPGFGVGKCKTPLLITSLERGELLAQWEIYSGLRRLHKPVEMLWLKRENAPHQLVKPFHRYVSQQTAVDWFDFWLNGHEDSDPGKAEQYNRWRDLKMLKNRAQSEKPPSARSAERKRASY